MSSTDAPELLSRIQHLEAALGQATDLIQRLATRVAALEGEPMASVPDATSPPVAREAMVAAEAVVVGAPAEAADAAGAAETAGAVEAAVEATDAGPATDVVRVQLAPVEPEPQPATLAEAAELAVHELPGAALEAAAAALELPAALVGPVAAALTNDPAARPGSPPAEAVSWERLIGGRWALWVGSLAIFLSMAFFLAYAWQFVAPWGKALMGLAFGMGVVGAGRVARHKAEGWFAAGLTGAGMGILYLNIWSALTVHALIGPLAAFMAMSAVCAFGVAVARRDGEQPLMILASAGGFVTPMLLQANTHGVLPDVGLEVYVAILNFGLLAVSVERRWPSAAWICIVGTISLAFATTLATESPWLGFAFAALYFGQFLATACLYSMHRQVRATPHDLMLLLKASLIFPTAGYYLIRDDLGPWNAAYMLVMAVLFAGLSRAGQRFWPANDGFRMATVGLAVTYLTVALRMILADDGLAVGLVVEATVLASLGTLLVAPRLTVSAYAVAVPAGIAVLGSLFATATRQVPLASEPALPLTAAVLATGWLWALGLRQAALAAADAPAPLLDAPPRLAEGDLPASLADDLVAAALDPGSAGGWQPPAWLRLPAGTAEVGLVAGGALLLFTEGVRWLHWGLLGPALGPYDLGAVAGVLLALWALALYHLGLRHDRPVLRAGAMIVLALAALGVGVGGPEPQLYTRPVAAAVVLGVLLSCRRNLPGPKSQVYAFEAAIGPLLPFILTGSAFWLVGQEIYDLGRVGLVGWTGWLAIAWIVQSTILETLSLRGGRGEYALLARMVALPAAGAMLYALQPPGTPQLPLIGDSTRALTAGVLAAAWLLALKRRHPAPAPAEGVPAQPKLPGLAGPALVWGGALLIFIEASQALAGQATTSWLRPTDLALVLAALLAGWAAAMYELGRRLDQLHVRVAAAAPLGMALLPLLIGGLYDGTGDLLLRRPLAAAGVMAALYACFRSASRDRTRLHVHEAEFLQAVPLGLLALGVWLASLEAFEAFVVAMPGPAGDRAAHVSVSLVWIASGVLSLLGGIRAGDRRFRLAGLGLMGLSCLKVFLLDLAGLELPYRVLSLGGLGGALIGISWLYSRFGVGQPERALPPQDALLAEPAEPD